MYDYQIRIMMDYVLPQSVYKQASWAVKDLKRMREQLDLMRNEAYVVQPRDMFTPVTGNSTGNFTDATASRAIAIAQLSKRIDAIEDAFMHVPEKYRASLLNYMAYGVPFPDDHNPKTWFRWKQIAIFHVAKNLKIF